MQNIIITIKNKKYEAILYDNSTTKELIKKFPITITMSDLNGNEKYYNFSKSFSTSSENVANINKGDIMLFGDNCLVIFYKSFSTRYRYTKLGYIKNLEDLENSLGKGDISITFEIEY
ncbi:cyclophilin-like fold protein [Brachyspira aalborgi]|nr:cyclophilin-like fold protein [Brachyspira aalborgi]